MQDMKESLKGQLIDAAGNVLYTYSVHWSIVNSLQKRNKGIKITQIVLTALSTGGFLASILSGIPQLSWIGGLTSALALALNLYMLNFNLSDGIRKHTDAANELWDVREAYKATIADIELLSIEEIRLKRDELTNAVSRINKSYPGTDEKSFIKAQKDIKKYQFADGEAEELLHFKNNRDT